MRLWLLAVRADKTTLSGLMRIVGRTVGAIVERVCTKARQSISTCEARRGLWNSLRECGDRLSTGAQGLSLGVVKNPEDLTRKQEWKLRTVEADNLPLCKPYVMEEQLRDILRTKGAPSAYMPDAWLEFQRAARVLEHEAEIPDQDGIRLPLSSPTARACHAQARKAT